MSHSSHHPVVTHIVSGDIWAGAEVQVYNLCKGLLAIGGIRPTAVVFNEGLLSQRLRGLGVKVDVADETKSNPLQIIRTIRRHCLKENSDVVHTHGFKENILGILGKDLAGVPRSVRTVHGNPETSVSLINPHKWLIRKMDLMFGRLRQQHIIAVSTQLEEAISRDFPRKTEKIFNFIDVDGVRQQWSRLPAFRNDLPRLGIVGRLVQVKRVDMFLETVASLNAQGLPCTGVVIGTGPLEQSLKDYASQLGISHRIDFLGFTDPVHEVVRTLDVLLMTSDHEGLPMALLEALALRVPVVAHNTGGIPEILDFGNCGWLVEHHSSEGYARAVRQLLASEKTAEEKLNAGLAYVSRNFGLEENTRKYIQLYQH